jgi:Uma2 family endonuclease
MVTLVRPTPIPWIGAASRNPHAVDHIMGMPAAVTSWTVEMLDALEDDGQRYELIDGELFVTPAPSNVHQLVAGEFFARLREYLRPLKVGRALFSPADLRRPDRRRNRVQPDVFVVRLTDGKHPAYPYDLSDLLLAIEVESPGNPELDYRVKRSLYLKHGVPEYWVVNPAAQIVSRFRDLNDPSEVFSQRITWQAPGIPDPLVVDLPALFHEALG